MSRPPALLFVAFVATLIARPAAAQWPFAPSATPAAPIAWVEDPAQALQTAQQTGRPIVAYVTSDHCGYCRKMERTTWTDPGVAGLVAAGAVPLKLDRDRHPEEVAALRVRAYPTTVVLSPQGRGLAGAAGFQSPEELTELLRAAMQSEAVAQRR